MTKRARQSVVLTEMDRAILDVLAVDPQASAAAVAETLRAPVAQVTARIRALGRRQVSRVLAVLDLAAAGQQVCFVLLDVRGRSVDAVAAEIAPMPEVMLISTLVGGPHDLLVLIRFTTVGALHDIIANQISTIEGIYHSCVSIVLAIPSFHPQYVRYDLELGSQTDVAETMRDLAREFPDNQVDDLDRQILAELLVNARQSINAIARKSKNNASTVRYRIRSLQSRGLMRFITVLDPPALGIRAFALVEIEPEANRLANIVASLRDRPWLPQIFVTTGPAPIKGIMQAEGMEAIKRIKSEELTQIDGIIGVSVSSLVSTRRMDLRWGQKYA